MNEPEVTHRGPGRPKRQEEVTTRRRRREELGANRNLKLYVPPEEKDPNFQYRWVNDRPGRIRQFTVEDDYDVVSSPAVESTSTGTNIERVVSQSTGENAVLLRKPKKFYEDDQAQKQAAIDAQERALKRAAPASPEGLTGPEAYVPGGKNTIGR
jgi:hypothetical protein